MNRFGEGLFAGEFVAKSQDFKPAPNRNTLPAHAEMDTS